MAAEKVQRGKFEEINNKDNIELEKLKKALFRANEKNELKSDLKFKKEIESLRDQLADEKCNKDKFSFLYQAQKAEKDRLIKRHEKVIKRFKQKSLLKEQEWEQEKSNMIHKHQQEIYSNNVKHNANIARIQSLRMQNTPMTPAPVFFQVLPQSYIRQTPPF